MRWPRATGRPPLPRWLFEVVVNPLPRSSHWWLSFVAMTGMWLSGARGARAELVEVRQIAAGMECAECARGLQLLVKRIDGVETTATSWNRRLLTVHFRSGNHATLGQIRELVVKQHFRVREAEVVVAGRLQVDSGGQASLLVPESGLTYRLDPGARKARDWIQALGSPAATTVVVTGRVPAGADDEQPDDPLVLAVLDIRSAGTGAAAVAGPAANCRE